MAESSFAAEVTGQMPGLYRFAMSLCGRHDRAEDLVQETVLRALSNEHTFQRGTNIGAWLFTILRNAFRSNYRKIDRREVEDGDGFIAQTLKVQPNQVDSLYLQEVLEKIDRLPPEQRDAIVRIGMNAESYDSVAFAQNVAIGTVKSRAGRARQKLHMTFPDEDATPLKQAGVTRAVWRPKIPRNVVRNILKRIDEERKPEPVRVFVPQSPVWNDAQTRALKNHTRRTSTSGSNSAPISAIPAAAVRNTGPDITIGDTGFQLLRKEVLSDGRVVQFFKALE